MNLDPCDDCLTCADCDRHQCDPRPYCEHRNVCDQCFPGSCEDCALLLESQGAL